MIHRQWQDYLGVAALGLAVLTGQSGYAQRSVAKEAYGLLHRMTATANREAAMRCADWGYTPLDSGRVISLCDGRVADTVFIAYLTKAGVPVGVKQQVFVPHVRVRAVTDSIRTHLTQLLGPAGKCSQSSMDQLNPFYTWVEGPYSVQLVMADEKPPPKSPDPQDYAWVGIQVAIANPTLQCNDWIPGRL